MTPGARVAAAIEVLDHVLAGGASAEQCLTSWARGHRFAGSKDRAAIRDHVFGALRALRSFAALGGGGMTGRAVMIGGAERAAGCDPALLFSGEGYAPPPLSEEECAWHPPALSRGGEALDMPDWLLPELERSLGGDDLERICESLRPPRAPVFLRANLARGTREEAQAALEVEGISTTPHPLAKTALQAIEGGRGKFLAAVPMPTGGWSSFRTRLRKRSWKGWTFVRACVFWTIARAVAARPLQWLPWGGHR